MAGKKVLKAFLAVLMLMTVSDCVRAEESDPLVLENRILLDKVEIRLEEFQQVVENGEEKRIPWENQGQIYPGQLVSKIPVITNLGAPC